MNIIQRFLAVLEKTAIANGMDKTKKISNEDDLLSNLSYLAKEKEDGTKYIPLHELRLVEKVLNGIGNTSFVFKDKEDVYYDKIGNDYICCANVYLVRHNSDGTQTTLGHGFCAKAWNQIIVPNVFNPTDGEKAAVWKAQAIGGAKSRALFEAGYGMDFYSDISLEEEILTTEVAEENSNSEEKAEKPKKASTKKSAPVDEDGLPIPQPKKKEEKEITFPKVTTDTTNINPDDIVADVGNYKGESLAEIEKVAPKNLVFLLRNSQNPLVQEEARRRIESIPELANKYL